MLKKRTCEKTFCARSANFSGSQDLLADDFVEGVQDFVFGILSGNFGALVYSTGAGKLKNGWPLTTFTVTSLQGSADLHAVERGKTVLSTGSGFSVNLCSKYVFPIRELP